MRASYRNIGETATDSHRLLRLDYASLCRPIAELPGQFVACCSYSENEVALTIGGSDSSDGRYSSLVSCFHRYLRMQLKNGAGRLISIAQEVNEMVYECCPNGCLLGCFFAIYSVPTRQLSYVNAGYGAPLLVRGQSSEVVPLEKGGPVFGLLRAPHYIERCTKLHPGDRFVAFTNTVIESFCTTNRGGADKLLIDLIRQHQRCSAMDLANAVLSEAEDFSGSFLIDRMVMTACADDTTFAVRPRHFQRAHAAVA